MVEVSHLSKNYGSHPAIRDLTFSVADGQVYGLLGPNGAGKSTIMNILTSYLAPTGGDVKVAGFSLPEQAQQAETIRAPREEATSASMKDLKVKRVSALSMASRTMLSVAMLAQKTTLRPMPSSRISTAMGTR